MRNLNRFVKTTLRPFFRSVFVPVFRPFTGRIRRYFSREIVAELQAIHQEIWEIKETQRENEALFFSVISTLRNPLPEVEAELKKIESRTAKMLQDLQKSLG